MAGASTRADWMRSPAARLGRTAQAPLARSDRGAPRHFAAADPQRVVGLLGVGEVGPVRRRGNDDIAQAAPVHLPGVPSQLLATRANSTVHTRLGMATAFNKIFFMS